MLDSAARAKNGDAQPTTVSAGDALPPTFKLMIHQNPDCSGKSFVCYILTVLGIIRSSGNTAATPGNAPGNAPGALPFTLLPFDAKKKTLHCFEDLIAPKSGLGRVPGAEVNPVVLHSFIARLRAVLAAEHSGSPRALSGANIAAKAPRWVIYGREDAKRRRWTNSKDVVAELSAAFAAGGMATSAVEVTYVPTMGGLSFKRQMELFVSATVFLAPHGAHMGNSLFFGDGTVVRELSCTGYSHLAIYPGLTKALAINFVSEVSPYYSLYLLVVVVLLSRAWRSTLTPPAFAPPSLLSPLSSRFLAPRVTPSPENKTIRLRRHGRGARTSRRRLYVYLERSASIFIYR